MTTRTAQAGLLGLLATACGGGADPAETLAAFEAPGPHTVGYRTLEAAYARPITGETRALTALVWYPAAAGATGEAPLYIFREPAAAVVDAPPAPLSDQPVVVLSHGHQGYPVGQSYLGEHLASHGYVVVAPTHVGNTFADGDRRTTDIYYLRAFDVGAAADAVRADGALGPLSGGPVAVVGHSFGGYTAFTVAGAQHDMDTLGPACEGGVGPEAFCSTMDAARAALFRGGLRDPRVSAIVSLDPGDFDKFSGAGVARVSTPVLHMVAEGSGFPAGQPAADDYWRAVPHPESRRVLLLGGAHNDFVEACGGGLRIRCSDLPATQVYRMVRTYVLAFLAQALLGEGAARPILDGQVAVSALAELSVP